VNPTILNREFQHPVDGWYQIEALGDHPNRAAGVVQVIDQEAASCIVNRFNAEAKAAQLRHGHELLIDHEHFADQPDQESRAYGWLQELQNRADGIYGRIRWTKTGKEAVDGGDYRFFSTEYSQADLKVLNSAVSTPNSALKRVRPLRLDGLTLTNMNNNRGQKPITNRDGSPTFAGARALVDSKPQTTGPKMKSVCTLLGLSAEADEASVHAAVAKLQNRNTTLEPLEAENKTLKNRQTALETENQTLLGEQVDALLDAHQVKEEKVRNRLKPLLVTMKNREDRVGMLTDCGFKAADMKSPDKGGRVLNRGEGRTPAEASTTEEEHPREKAQRITNRAREIQQSANGRISFEAAHQQAASELNK
jgi:phage I-like protein